MDEIESPCTGKCCLNEKDICFGCLRSLEEITEWGGASHQRKKEILQFIATHRMTKKK